MKTKINSFESKIETILTREKNIDNLSIINIVINISNQLFSTLSNNRGIYGDLMSFHNIDRRNTLYRNSVEFGKKREQNFTEDMKEQIALVILIRYLSYAKAFYLRSYNYYDKIDENSIEMGEWILGLLGYSPSKLVKIKTILPYINLKKGINISTDYLTGNMIREAEMQYLMLQNGNYIKIIQNLRQELFNVFGKKFTNQEWTENQISLIKKVDDDLKILQGPYFSEPEVQLYNFNLLHNMELLKEALKKFKK